MKRLGLVFAAVFVLSLPAAAHVLDEYLEASHIAITRDAVTIDLRLIPGIEVEDRVFAVIDADHDGEASAAEQQAYIDRVFSDLSLSVDTQSTPLTIVNVRFPARSEISDGVGSIRIDLAAKLDLQTAGDHELTFRNDHFPEIGVYLANALLPTNDAINITSQERDELQHQLKVEFRFLPPTVSSGWRAAFPYVLVLAFALLVSLAIGKRVKG